MIRPAKVLLAFGIAGLALWGAKALRFSPSASPVSAPKQEEGSSPPSHLAAVAPKLPPKEAYTSESSIETALPSPAASVAIESAEDSHHEEIRPPEVEDKSPRLFRLKAEMIVMGGLDKSVIIEIMDRGRPQLSRCFRKPRQPERLRLDARILISPSGHVEKADIKDMSTLTSGEDRKMALCALGVVKRLIFPEPLGGGWVEVEYPIYLPSEPEEEAKS